MKRRKYHTSKVPSRPCEVGEFLRISYLINQALLYCCVCEMTENLLAKLNGPLYPNTSRFPESTSGSNINPTENFANSFAAVSSPRL